MAQANSTSRLVLGIALFVLIGSPMVGYLWEALNNLLAGHVRPLQLLIAVPVAALFFLLLRFMGRTVLAWDSGRGPSSDSGTR